VSSEAREQAFHIAYRFVSFMADHRDERKTVLITTEAAALEGKGRPGILLRDRTGIEHLEEALRLYGLDPQVDC